MATNPVKENVGVGGGEATRFPILQEREGIKQVDDLYAEYLASPLVPRQWTFISRLVDVALAVIPYTPIGDFATADADASLSGHDYEFIQDTFKFIAKGQRNLDIPIWSDLLTTTARTPSRGNQYYLNRVDRRELRNYILNERIDTEPTRLVQAWLAKPNGVADLIGTLFLLVGTRTERVNRANLPKG